MGAAFGGACLCVERAKVKITLYFNFMRQCTVRRRVCRFMTKFTYKQLIKCRAKHLLCFKNGKLFWQMFAKADCVYAACAPLNVYGCLFLAATSVIFALLFLVLLLAISFAKIFLVSALKFHWCACVACANMLASFILCVLYSRVLQRVYAAATAGCVCVCVSKLWSLNTNKTLACLPGVLRQFLCVPSFAYFNACDELPVWLPDKQPGGNFGGLLPNRLPEKPLTVLAAKVSLYNLPWKASNEPGPPVAMPQRRANCDAYKVMARPASPSECLRSPLADVMQQQWCVNCKNN